MSQPCEIRCGYIENSTLHTKLSFSQSPRTDEATPGFGKNYLTGLVTNCLKSLPSTNLALSNTRNKSSYMDTFPFLLQ